MSATAQLSWADDQSTAAASQTTWDFQLLLLLLLLLEWCRLDSSQYSDSHIDARPYIRPFDRATTHQHATPGTERSRIPTHSHGRSGRGMGLQSSLHHRVHFVDFLCCFVKWSHILSMRRCRAYDPLLRTGGSPLDPARYSRKAL